ncbi:MAG TPA: hypothetical protein VFF09_03725 [archaeon]|nr:hypothetical protein [archaeon]
MDFTPASGAGKIHASENEHPAPEGAGPRPHLGQGGLSLPTGAKSPKGERVEGKVKIWLK